MITFQSETNFSIRDKNKIKSWIKSVIISEKKNIGDIAFVFFSDDQLLEINKKYLNHDYYTDVITFDYCENDIVSGDVLISIDRVKDNAISFNESFERELLRVMIHGVFHLLGYQDKTKEQQKIMRLKENEALNLINLEK